MRDLETPVPWIYWTDLLTSACFGWTAITVACMAAANDDPALAACTAVVASLAFYRAAMFIHEISHLRSGALPGFTLAWNMLVGLPLLLPSFMYLGIHKFHHKTETYGTLRDPEYVPLAGMPLAIVASTLTVLLLPGALALRLLVAAPLGLLVPRLHYWLERHASALAINVFFERETTADERRTIRLLELAVLVVWGTALAAAAFDLLAWQVFAIWYAVAAGAFLLNHLRALAAHGYKNHSGTPMTRAEQLLDSIDTPGGLWTELWAPVGLRYHALHHELPGIPYHNLPTAFRRLHPLAADDSCRRGTSPGMWSSLRRLWLGRKEAA
jgi:fatty acid desaturase